MDDVRDIQDLRFRQLSEKMSFPHCRAEILKPQSLKSETVGKDGT